MASARASIASVSRRAISRWMRDRYEWTSRWAPSIVDLEGLGDRGRDRRGAGSGRFALKMGNTGTGCEKGLISHHPQFAPDQFALSLEDQPTVAPDSVFRNPRSATGGKLLWPGSAQLLISSARFGTGVVGPSGSGARPVRS